MHFEKRSLKGITPFNMYKIIKFPENLKKFWVSQEILVGSGYPKHRYFFIWPYNNKATVFFHYQLRIENEPHLCSLLLSLETSNDVESVA